MISVHSSTAASQRGERPGMGVMTFGHQPALRVARPSTRTEDRVQLGSGRVGVAQLIQPSQREDERLLDRIGGIFPAAKEMERVEVESGPMSGRALCPGPSIAA